MKNKPSNKIKSGIHSCLPAMPILDKFAKGKYYQYHERTNGKFLESLCNQMHPWVTWH